MRRRSSFQSASSRMSAWSTSTLPFAAQVRSSLETHVELFTSCCSFAASPCPGPPVLAAREYHDPHLLACAGMAVNIHPIDLDHAEQLLGAPGAPAVQSSSAGCCGRLSRWVVLARGEFSRDEFSTSDDDHGVFGQLYFMNVLAVHFSKGLWFARVRAASRCVLVRLSWRTEMVRDRIANCSSVLVSLWFLSDL